MRYGITLIVANYITSSEWLIQFPNPSGVEWYYLWDCSVMDKKHDTWSLKSWSSIHIVPQRVFQETLFLFSFSFSLHYLRYQTVSLKDSNSLLSTPHFWYLSSEDHFFSLQRYRYWSWIYGVWRCVFDIFCWTVKRNARQLLIFRFWLIFDLFYFFKYSLSKAHICTNW